MSFQMNQQNAQFVLIDVSRCGYDLREYSHAQQHLLAVTDEFATHLFPHYQIRSDTFGTVPGHRPNSVNLFDKLRQTF